MKIKLIEKVEQEKECDVKFPIYRWANITEGEGYILCTQYSRISINKDNTMTYTSIIIEDKFRAEIYNVPNYSLNENDTNYLLNKGGPYDHASSKEEFEEALQKAKDLINSI